MEMPDFPYRSERLKQLNDRPIRKEATYVLYWMQQSQRARWNMALEYAALAARQWDMSVVVCFGLMKNYPDATARHYHFMLQGLQQAASDLAGRGVKMVLRIGSPEAVAIELARDAALVVCDVGYLKHQRKWRSQLAENVDVRCIQIEDNVLVPVGVASDKQEYAARTLRPKITRHWELFREQVVEVHAAKASLRYAISGEDLDKVEALLRRLQVAADPGPVQWCSGGWQAATRRWEQWLEQGYSRYSAHRNKPQHEHVSHMSPYLHFGQVSPLWLLEQLKHRRGDNRAEYEEELVVRRELAINFVYYCPDYDSYSCLPQWAAESLEKHKPDPRTRVYTRDELEQARTDDPYWNQAMRTMVHRGYLHNHMRMYWGKRILAYCNTPQYAYHTALYLNNKYFLDGRDPNSYASVAWLFGLHDRGWTERKVYGKVRIMTRGGLERKIDTEAYLNKYSFDTSGA